MKWERGGTPAEPTNHLNLLHTDYRESAETMTTMGFNGAMFNIKPPVVSKTRQEYNTSSTTG